MICYAQPPPSCRPDPPRHEQGGEEGADAEIPKAFRWDGWELKDHGLLLPSSGDESDGASSTSQAVDRESHTIDVPHPQTNEGSDTQVPGDKPQAATDHASGARAPQGSNVTSTARVRPRNDSGFQYSNPHQAQRHTNGLHGSSSNRTYKPSKPRGKRTGLGAFAAADERAVFTAEAE